MGKPHILIIDDDVYIIDALQTYLELLGYRVSHAYGCEQAKAKLRTQDKVDLIVLDYLLPDGSGVDLLQSMSSDKTLQRPPVIMSSGVLDPKTPIWEALRKRLHKDSQLLIQAYVSKPYTLDAMDVALHEVLGGDYIPGPRVTRHQTKVSE
jgi:DNA-binding response OmpR family regulator